MTAPIPVAVFEPTVEGTVVGDDRTAMEAAIDAGPSAPAGETRGGKWQSGGATRPWRRTLRKATWSSAAIPCGELRKFFLRDPWFWPEIWQVNKQSQNPHLIYPGDTLRLVYIDGPCARHPAARHDGTRRLRPRPASGSQ